MRKHNYTVELTQPTAAEFVHLRQEVGWGELPLDLAQAALEQSLFHVAIRMQGELIAMARVIGDGALFFYIQDVIVAPSYQKQGLGAVLMEQIQGYLATAASKGATVGLLSAKGKEPFYQRYGYLLRPSEQFGAGMCAFI
ncbi:GNAT family N-acetyltransferase [Pseudoalteromonas tunicata]|jgi:predicted GNAT family N-acyltransferase|uniref:Acetyltransferase, GNAT family protein n=1 Tax=Pseudoalteromonas tunicata D2 TaxID=87626 RepID=A4CAK0_9GAMM|nr:GNAT family N-acetyltransferase [Pseudoalteromonas tunicata]ATC94954.1 hypothetical protein PTUN_a2482 [Pseudoalteromonas tunicata]AXT30616.1 N-acetyltransferase [Pseudoalteromonas tunicata]EAR28408.1 acetyltransferase, GNAT family protein [Pseudoalteromonas tunicata D2]MDP4985778.1 GNAT family N-acetyltransferase [Pseudoalteromonas tunicata]